MSILLASAMDLVAAGAQAATVSLVFGSAIIVSAFAPAIAGVMADAMGTKAAFMFGAGDSSDHSAAGRGDSLAAVVRRRSPIATPGSDTRRPCGGEPTMLWRQEAEDATSGVAARFC